ncbi:TetR/AcrR family transcriptional regulator [Actinoplanes sp. NPDC049265]|uniref:TetR/AcrR family transcriptional regulator n=1 Tax=Actinoplanes sp. NPDC049265 TaxID=3363902 RepID=UPI003715FA98
MTEQLVGKLRSDARDNRDRIVEAAREAFASDGLDVPMREVARRAGVGLATVYRRFPTKEALLTAAFAEQMQACERVLDEALTVPDPWAGLCRAIDKVLALHALDSGFARAMTAQYPRVFDFADGRDRSLRKLLGLMRRAKESGGLRPDVVLEDVVLAMMANDGIRAESPELRLAATRRFAALMLQSFSARPVPLPLPPAVRLPLTVRA